MRPAVVGWVLCVGLAALSACATTGLEEEGEGPDSLRGGGVSDRGGRAPEGMTLTQMHSEKRVALVIGNGAYQTKSFSPLKNPTNDAIDMAKALRASGFEVIRCAGKAGSRCLNLNRKEMGRAFRAFGAELAGGGVGLFYYAGHGIQIGGQNYLVPVDADMSTEADVDSEAHSVQAVLNKMGESQGRLNIVILDACRNNPFEKRFRSASSRSGGGSGLAAVSKGQLPTGTLLAFSTSPGRVASDGKGRNGTYTAALLKHMSRPGLRMRDMFDHVRVDVERQTGAKQLPWENAALRPGRFYFALPGLDDRSDGCPEGTVASAQGCVAVVQKVCPAGTHFVERRGCVPVIVDEKCPEGRRFVAGRGCVRVSHKATDAPTIRWPGAARRLAVELFEEEGRVHIVTLSDKRVRRRSFLDRANSAREKQRQVLRAIFSSPPHSLEGAELTQRIEDTYNQGKDTDASTGSKGDVRLTRSYLLHGESHD